MTAEEYRALRALSASGMKDLAVSPMRYWYKHINPDYEPEEPTPAQRFGIALHSAVLEPDVFAASYACELNRDDYPDALVTIDDIRSWIRDNGERPKGTRKDEVLRQAQSMGCPLPLWDIIVAEHAAACADRTVLSIDEWQRLGACSAEIMDQPRAVEVLYGGTVESVHRAEYEDIQLKGRFDFQRGDLISDLKTFVCQRSRSIDESINAAIWYEQYYRQMYFYALLHELETGRHARCVLVFVESEPPHEVRIKEFRPKTLYWERAKFEVQELIGRYKEHLERFGEQPWRALESITQVRDEELPAALAY